MNHNPPLGPSAHVDTFTRDNLPPFDQWPDLILDRPEFQYPERLNIAVELTDRMVEQGFGDRVALIGNGRRRTYKELPIGRTIQSNCVKPKSVLIAGNKYIIAAVPPRPYLGLYHAAAASADHRKAEVSLALTDSRIADELVAAAKSNRFLKKVVSFDGTSNHDAELDRIALDKPVKFDAVRPAATMARCSDHLGTTGEPKATMHFHRDLLIADGYARDVLNTADVFVGRHRWPSRSALAGWRFSPCGLAPPRRCWKMPLRPI